MTRLVCRERERGEEPATCARGTSLRHGVDVRGAVLYMKSYLRAAYLRAGRHRVRGALGRPRVSKQKRRSPRPQVRIKGCPQALQHAAVAEARVLRQHERVDAPLLHKLGGGVGVEADKESADVRERFHQVALRRSLRGGG